jgi:endonuclease/exonuclease/phosphatase (EEP) superfamily protein YafD
MNTELKEQTPAKTFSYTIIAILVVGAVLVVFPPEIRVFKIWASYVAQITIAYWLLGLLFLAAKQTRLTFTAFICCAFLCIVFKKNNPSIVEPFQKTNLPVVKVAHYNISATNSGYKPTIETVQKINADVISFQEVTPDWHKAIYDSLKTTHPYSCSVLSNDLFSMEVYSRFPFSYCDTFYCENAPTILIGFKTAVPSKDMYVYSSYIAPPLFTSASELMRKQFTQLADKIKTVNTPAITLGEYNVHPSSSEILEFRTNAALTDSRRGFRPVHDDGHFSLLEVPTDHIFYTSHFNCIEFKTISGPQSEHLGILGTYQLKADSLLSAQTLNWKR